MTDHDQNITATIERLKTALHDLTQEVLALDLSWQLKNRKGSNAEPRNDNSHKRGPFDLNTPDPDDYGGE